MQALRQRYKEILGFYWLCNVLLLVLSEILYVLLDWKWSLGQRQRQEYISILNAFIDKKDSYYSIHQIGTTKVNMNIFSIFIYIFLIYLVQQWWND